MIASSVIAGRHRPGLVVLWPQADGKLTRRTRWRNRWATSTSCCKQILIDEFLLKNGRCLQRLVREGLRFFDTWIWNGMVQLVSFAVLGLSWLNDFVDRFIVNLGFDGGCGGVRLGGRIMSRLQDGRVQNYLRVIGIALTALVLALLWGCRS
jgi:hypothetical protein